MRISMKRFTEKALATTAFLSTLGCTLVLLPLAFDGTALALDTKAPGMDAPMHHGPMASERVEARIAYAKTALKITDAQTKQWNAVADVLRKQAKDRDATMQEMRGMHDMKMTAIDRLDQRQNMLTKAAASTAEMLAVAKPLYATLSDEQKQTADELLMPKWGKGRWGHEGHGPEGHGPGGHGPDGHGPGPAPAQ
jgi:hypothetical protein